jgi:hypothetical protein
MQSLKDWRNRHKSNGDYRKKSGLQLDLGGGANPMHGFVNIDVRDLPQVDIVHDLSVFPWPLENESCIRIMAGHLVEHINPANFGFIKFMDEAWRVAKPGAEFMISMPYGFSPGYVQDPTHCNPCNEATWAYFDPLNTHSLWGIYQPKPWYYRWLAFDVMWSLEVLLMRHSEDPELWAQERESWGSMTYG